MQHLWLVRNHSMLYLPSITKDIFVATTSTFQLQLQLPIQPSPSDITPRQQTHVVSLEIAIPGSEKGLILSH